MKSALRSAPRDMRASLNTLIILPSPLNISSSSNRNMASFPVAAAALNKRLAPQYMSSRKKRMNSCLEGLIILASLYLTRYKIRDINLKCPPMPEKNQTMETLESNLTRET